MRNLMWIPVFLPVFVIKTVAENKTGESEVFVRASHAEAQPDYKVTTEAEIVTTTDTITVSTTERTTEIVFGEVSDTVVFVPNERPVERFDYGYDQHNKMRIKDIMMSRTVGDVVDKTILIETEKPLEDIIFLSGKNTEHIIEEEKKPNARTRERDNTRRSGTELEERKENIERVKLNCRQLDCNNTVKSLCGGKMEHKLWRYRLFLNECYFRKVNCNFKFESNRYKQVPNEKCKNMGVHEISHSYKPKSFSMPEQPEKSQEGRRSYSSRRSLPAIDRGLYCSHACPASCPEQYAPECAASAASAASAAGQRRVFVNHCQLDLHSCTYGTVWHRRPLSDCVGSSKADVRRNRGFIGWMQRIGILDGKGRVIKQ